jgi:hypothetical protein
MRPRFFDSKGNISFMTALTNWLSLGDYELAKQAATDRIVRRQSRGSIFAQNGWYITKKQLEKNSKDADAHIRHLREHLKRA